MVSPAFTSSGFVSDSWAFLFALLAGFRPMISGVDFSDFMKCFGVLIFSVWCILVIADILFVLPLTIMYNGFAKS